jgi:hypothetical protein
MKKLLIGLGIAFGVVVVLVIGGLVVGGLWLKSKVDDAVGSATEFAEQTEAVEKRTEELNRRFSFQAPPKGMPITLTEGRLQEYLAIRATLQPVFDTYEQKLKEQNEAMGEKAGLGDAIKAAGTLGAFLNGLRTTWLDGLESKRMSPKEFHTITAALYTSNWGVAMGDFKKQARPAMEKMKAELESQLATATDPAIKQALEQQLASVKEQLDSLPADAGETEKDRIHRANHELYTKYKTQIEEQAAHGLDVLLAGDAQGLGEAFEGMGFGADE